MYWKKEMQIKYKEQETIIADVNMTFYTNKQLSAL